MGTLADSAECSPENLRFRTLSPFARAPPPVHPIKTRTSVRKVAPHPTHQLLRWLNGALADASLSEKRSDTA